MYLIYVLLGIYREYWDILGTYIYIYTRHIGKLQEDQEGQGIGHQVHVEVVVMDGEISCRHQSLKGNEFRQELCWFQWFDGPFTNQIHDIHGDTADI